MDFHFKNKDDNWNRKKDELHKRRRELAEEMKDGIMSISQMKRGTDGIMSHREQVEKYDKWKEVNQKRMSEWSEINREFKKHGEEGRVHTIDDIRPEGKLRFD